MIHILHNSGYAKNVSPRCVRGRDGKGTAMSMEEKDKAGARMDAADFSFHEAPPQAAEPIPFPRPQMAPVPFPAKSKFDAPAYRWASREERFYRQALEWALRTGDECSEVVFFCYYPTYDSMSGAQQRWYFYWRTLLRRGEYRDTSLSYIFVYLFELLNQVGTASPEEGLGRMLKVWRAYRGSHKELDRYLPAWIKSYVIFYGCAADYIDLILDVEQQTSGRYLFVELFVRLFTFKKSQHILDVIDNISTYRVSHSKFVAQNRDMMEQTLCAVLLSYNEYLISKKRRSLADRFVKLRQPARWYPFSGAVFYAAAQKKYCQDRDVAVLECFRYFTNSVGEWYIDAPGSFYDYDRRTRNYIAFIVKATELTLRELAGSRGRLRHDGIPSELLDAVRTFVTKFYYLHYATQPQKTALRQKSEAVRTLPPPPVEFEVNAARLEELRRESDEICGLLTDGFDENTEAAPPPPPPVETPETPADIVPDSDASDGFGSFAAALASPQRKALGILLAGQDVAARLSALAMKLGCMTEPMLDDINALAAERTGDGVIDTAGPCVYEEYEAGLRAALGDAGQPAPEE